MPVLGRAAQCVRGNGACLFYIGAYMANNERNSRSSERDVQQPDPPHPLREDEENLETVDQDPGERQKRNQGEEREDPLAA